MKYLRVLLFFKCNTNEQYEYTVLCIILLIKQVSLVIFENFLNVLLGNSFTFGRVPCKLGNENIEYT